MSREADPVPAAGGDADGSELARALEGRLVGEAVQLRRPLEVLGRDVNQAILLRDFRTASKAKLLYFLPSGDRYICKLGDLRQEHALMAAVREMNRRWRQCGLTVCGAPLEAVTYEIVPLGAQAGLVEEVPDSRNLCEMSQGYSFAGRHLRVLDALGGEPARLDRLAAATAGYLTMSYVLGIRDGHDENLMLRSDGALFRVDLGYAFGRAPEVDAPAVFVPRAVAHALGPRRWAEVVRHCGLALRALSGEGDGVRTLNLEGGAKAAAASGAPPRLASLRCASLAAPPGWDCLRCVPELGPLFGQVRSHLDTLSFAAFEREVEHASEWSFSRSAKNTLRQAARFFALAQEDLQRAGLDRLKFAGLDPIASFARKAPRSELTPPPSIAVGTIGEGL